MGQLQGVLLVQPQRVPGVCPSQSAYNSAVILLRAAATHALIHWECNSTNPLEMQYHDPLGMQYP